MKAAGAFVGLPRELRTRHNLNQNIGLSGQDSESNPGP